MQGSLSGEYLPKRVDGVEPPLGWMGYYGRTSKKTKDQDDPEKS